MDGGERDRPHGHAQLTIGRQLPECGEVELRPRRNLGRRIITVGSGLYLPEDCRLEFPASSSAASLLS